MKYYARLGYTTDKKDFLTCTYHHDILGTGGVYKLDGRLNIYSMVCKAREYFKTLKNIYPHATYFKIFRVEPDNRGVKNHIEVPIQKNIYFTL